MASAFGNLNGSGPQQVWLNFYYSSYSQANNESTWGYELRYYGNGWGSWINSSQSWSISGFGFSRSGTFTIPQSEAYNTYKVLASGTFKRKHDSAGRLAAGNLVGAISTNHSTIGSGSVSVPSGTPPRIPKTPSKPARPTFKSATTTSISFGISAPDNGGSPISTYLFQAATNSSFGTIVRSWSSGSLNQVASPLAPGTTHWIRYRAQNAIGLSPWSDSISATTMPAVAPGGGVTPTISGTGASVAFSTPGISPTSYRVQYRPLGGSAVTRDSLTAPISVTGLTPGQSYEWRSSIFVNDYQSPWTDWTLVTQPNPNTSPGEFFDGSTPTRQDLTFAWLGTAGSSMSEARGVGVAGWTTSTAMAPLQRVSGGLFGTFCSRQIFLQDASASAVYIVAQTQAEAAAVAEGGQYVASIYVRPSRDQRLRLQIYWMNAANTTLETVEGEPIVAPAGEWTRLTAEGLSPLDTVKARLRIFDTAVGGGEGHSNWQSGEWLDFDGAMLTIGSQYGYFDGATPDTTEYTYAWLGATNASASIRTTNEIEPVDPLADPDCPPTPRPPRPPRIEDSCVEETGSWRRYWAIISEGEVFDWLSVVPTITLNTGDIAARQVRIRFHANPDSLAPEQANDLPIESEQIISYMPPNAQLTLDGVSQSVWVDVGQDDPLPGGHLLYGKAGGPASWPTLDCGSAYLVSFDVPLDAPAGNLSIGVALTTRMM